MKMFLKNGKLWKEMPAKHTFRTSEIRKLLGLDQERTKFAFNITIKRPLLGVVWFALVIVLIVSLYLQDN